jgi:hypothetical protein
VASASIKAATKKTSPAVLLFTADRNACRGRCLDEAYAGRHGSVDAKDRETRPDEGSLQGDENDEERKRHSGVSLDEGGATSRASP